MFSATMQPAVEQLAKQFMHVPVVITVGDMQGSRNKRITQKVCFLGGEGAKLRTLLDEMKRASPLTIIFVNIKKNCDVVARALEREGFPVTVLHGGRTQEQREAALNSFREGWSSVLVATDVAGRGLDIKGVNTVINYDMPESIDRYCHRIGRTGRAGNTGASISLITDADAALFYDLKQYLESTGSDVPRELATHPAAESRQAGSSSSSSSSSSSTIFAQ